jgi:hypothetical protein
VRHSEGQAFQTRLFKETVHALLGGGGGLFERELIGKTGHLKIKRNKDKSRVASGSDQSKWSWSRF